MIKVNSNLLHALICLFIIIISPANMFDLILRNSECILYTILDLLFNHIKDCFDKLLSFLFLTIYYCLLLICY